MTSTYLLRQVSVIIPEHNRPKHLRRLLDYFLSYGLKIIVADSSAKPFEYRDEYTGKIVYHFLPGSPLAEKLHFILPEIDTPYVFMCANDDFIIPETVEILITFLEQHPDYNSGQGIYIDFCFNGDEIVTAPRYLKTMDVNLDAASGVERMFHLQSNYFQYYYCVFRTQTFAAAVTSVIKNGKTSIKNLCLLESYISVYGAIDGKHIIMPRLYAVRENITDSAASNTETIPDIIRRKKESGELAGYMDLLAGQLAKKDGLPFDQARSAIREGLKAYVCNSYPDFYTIKGQAKALVKDWLKAIDVFHLRNRLAGRGYRLPANFDPAQLAGGEYWEKIKLFILKHKHIYR